MMCRHGQLLASKPDVVACDHSALVVVDVQNDFAHPDGFTARAGGDVSPTLAAITKVNEAIALFREHGRPVIFLREVVRPETVLGNFLARCGAYESCPVRVGTWGSEWYQELTPPRSDEPIVEKPAYDGFNQSRLDQTLKHFGARTCVYVGFASNVCVEATARHGFEMGYYTALLHDASAGDTPAGHQRCVETWRGFYGPVMTVCELAELWTRARDAESVGAPSSSPRG